MVKVGLVGFGMMGHMHFENYVRLAAEGVDVQLVAICDVRIEELKYENVTGNIATDTDHAEMDLSAYHLYDDLEKMLADESLDVIDLTLPTDLHAPIACDLLARGYHVFCEKPMAIHTSAGQQMVDAAHAHQKQLMIGQCLRFWPAYEYLQKVVTEQSLGQVISATFFRGGATPKGWFVEKERSGGAMLDMHIHDVDIIQWVFGLPEHVSSIARNVVPGSGYDVVSTNYIYADGKVVNAQVDWTLQGDYGFEMSYRVNFEQGNLVFINDMVQVNPNNGAGYTAELSSDRGYYRQLRYFIECLIEGQPMSQATPESTLRSLQLVEAEMLSADLAGDKVSVAQVLA